MFCFNRFFLFQEKYMKICRRMRFFIISGNNCKEPKEFITEIYLLVFFSGKNLENFSGNNKNLRKRCEIDNFDFILGFYKMRVD